MIIDQLPSITLPVEDTDEMPIERGQLTYKINLADLLNSASADITVIAAEYDPTASYAVGDYCTHDGLFYICITPVTAEAWDSTKWDEVTVGEELNMVYVGASAPTSDAVKIWLDTDEPGMSAVSSVNGKTGTVVIDDIPMTLLWENASPTSAFSAQTVQIDLSDYDYVCVLVKYNVSSPIQWTEFAPVGSDIYITRNVTANTSPYMYMTARRGTISSTGIAFLTGTQSTPSSGGDYTTVCIPLKIYGIKLS